MRKQFVIVLGVGLSAILAFQMVAAIVLCIGTLHIRHKPLTAAKIAVVEAAARRSNAQMETVQIASFDGVDLRGWFFRPQQGNGSVVIVLHGHGDNRVGSAGFAPMLLRHHYAVLDPDSRAHGESGGEIATFGFDEARDLSRWVDWLAGQNYRGCVYGLGESMGAAIVLQALPSEPRFCAVVAESPYASFREIGYDRLTQRFGNGWWTRELLVAPLVSEGFWYARLRYGIDLDQVSPATRVASTRVPVLLIHGMNDFNIVVRHCREILQNHSGEMELWEVPGAGHTQAYKTEPEEFERRVTGWFDRHTTRN
jgi:uncharacterized protein